MAQFISLPSDLKFSSWKMQVWILGLGSGQVTCGTPAPWCYASLSEDSEKQLQGDDMVTSALAWLLSSIAAEVSATEEAGDYWQLHSAHKLQTSLFTQAHNQACIPMPHLCLFMCFAW